MSIGKKNGMLPSICQSLSFVLTVTAHWTRLHIIHQIPKCHVVKVATKTECALVPQQVTHFWVMWNGASTSVNRVTFQSVQNSVVAVAWLSEQTKTFLLFDTVKTFHQQHKQKKKTTWWLRLSVLNSILNDPSWVNFLFCVPTSVVRIIAGMLDDWYIAELRPHFTGNALLSVRGESQDLHGLMRVACIRTLSKACLNGKSYSVAEHIQCSRLCKQSQRFQDKTSAL